MKPGSYLPRYKYVQALPTWGKVSLYMLKVDYYRVLTESTLVYQQIEDFSQAGNGVC